MTSDQPSLRALARRLGCSHAALSKRVHEGYLTRGVALDGRGRVVVTDADAAAAQWAQIHIPTHQELMRQPAPAPPAPSLLDTVLPDHHYDRLITAAELFEERDTASLLVTALVATVMDGAGAGADLDGPELEAIRERVAAKLRTVADLHGADAAAVDRADHELGSVLAMLTLPAESVENAGAGT